MTHCFIAISGAPGTGKTTIGRELAPRLAAPLFDKDDVLESLFEAFGTGGPEWRTRLSRASDLLLQTMVHNSQGAVIVSFWHTAGMPPNSGTPTAWLEELSSQLIEVHCTCAPDIAVERFRRRTRHAGHADETRDPRVLEVQIAECIGAGAIGIGRLVTVQTDKPVNVDNLISELSD